MYFNVFYNYIYTWTFDWYNYFCSIGCWAFFKVSSRFWVIGSNRTKRPKSSKNAILGYFGSLPGLAAMWPWKKVKYRYWSDRNQQIDIHKWPHGVEPVETKLGARSVFKLKALSTLNRVDLWWPLSWRLHPARHITSIGCSLGIVGSDFVLWNPKSSRVIDWDAHIVCSAQPPPLWDLRLLWHP